MSGWLSLRVSEARGHGSQGTKTMQVAMSCPGGVSEAAKGDGGLTEMAKCPRPAWEHVAIWRVPKPEAVIRLVLMQDNVASNIASGITNNIPMAHLMSVPNLPSIPGMPGIPNIMGATKAAEGTLPVAKGDGGATWVPLYDPKAPRGTGAFVEILVEWQFTYSHLAPLFSETDEDQMPYVPEKYSQAQLQVEIGRISAHGMAMLTPVFWLLDLWYWKRPYESACVGVIGGFVMYYDAFHVALPFVFLVVMVLNFLKKFTTSDSFEEAKPASLGFLGTIGWVHETLKLTQNYFKMTTDAADMTFEMFTWENQDMSTYILLSLIGCLLLHCVASFPTNLILLTVWVYMFTYFPLGFFLPQMYTALLPHNLPGVVKEIALGRDVVLKKESPLHITSITIPKQGKKRDGSVYFQVVSVMFPPREDGKGHADKAETFTSWHRYSDFSNLRDRLDRIDVTMSAKGFPSKKAFNVTGEALNARRRDLEDWLCRTAEQANLTRGRPLRAPLLGFLQYSAKASEGK